MNGVVSYIDTKIIAFMRAADLGVGRVALFVVFFWFGILKIFYTSPANPLVDALLLQTLPFIPFEIFIVLFSIFEMVIGIVFLVPRWERAAIFLLTLHMITTFLPLIFLPNVTWQGWFVPTLEGQYIIKNLVIVALAMSVAAHLTPFGSRHRQ